MRFGNSNLRQRFIRWSHPRWMLLYTHFAWWQRMCGTQSARKVQVIQQDCSRDRETRRSWWRDCPNRIVLPVACPNSQSNSLRLEIRQEHYSKGGENGTVMATSQLSPGAKLSREASVTLSRED